MIVGAAVADQRYAICQSCEDFLTLTKQCRLCLCLMPLKVKWDKAECPAGKWGKIDAD